MARAYDLSSLTTSLTHHVPFTVRHSTFVQVTETCATQCGSDKPCELLKAIVYTAKCTSEGITCKCDAELESE